MDILKESKRIFEIEILELQKVKEKLDFNIEKALKIILESTGKVVLTGIGKSGIIGKKISATLASTGTESIFMNSAEGLHGDLGMINKDDIVIAISNSGNSDEVLAIVPAIRKIGSKIIAMTGNINSKLAKLSDVVLDIGVEQEACPMNLAPTSSTTATLVMGDALASLLIMLKKFQPENFALYHPGGSLGRRLLLRVKDIMHSGDELAIVSRDASVENIIIEMTDKRLGVVCIVENEHLLGIITEGDIRRALKNKENFFNLQAQDIMSKNPIMVDKEIMAIEALELMENRDSQISVIPVVENRQLVGVVRIHDLINVQK